MKITRLNQRVGVVNKDGIATNDFSGAWDAVATIAEAFSNAKVSDDGTYLTVVLNGKTLKLQLIA